MMNWAYWSSAVQIVVTWNWSQDGLGMWNWSQDGLGMWTYLNNVVIQCSSFVSVELVEDLIHWKGEGGLSSVTVTSTCSVSPCPRNQFLDKTIASMVLIHNNCHDLCTLTLSLIEGDSSSVSSSSGLWRSTAAVSGAMSSTVLSWIPCSDCNLLMWMYFHKSNTNDLLSESKCEVIKTNRIIRQQIDINAHLLIPSTGFSLFIRVSGVKPGAAGESDDIHFIIASTVTISPPRAELRIYNGKIKGESSLNVYIRSHLWICFSGKFWNSHPLTCVRLREDGVRETKSLGTFCQDLM